jgi:hypothetical protein
MASHPQYAIPLSYRHGAPRWDEAELPDAGPQGLEHRGVHGARVGGIEDQLIEADVSSRVSTMVAIAVAPQANRRRAMDPASHPALHTGLATGGHAASRPSGSQ